MNSAVSFLESAAAVLAELPGAAVTSFLRMVGERTGLFGDGLGGGLGLVTSGLSGIAAALAVAIASTLYVHGGSRSLRGVAKGVLAVAAMLALVSFVAYDMRHASLAYLGINPAKPALQFEIRLPKGSLTDVADTQVELHTDRNQRLAQVQGADDAEDGRSVIRGRVSLDFLTSDRVVILNLPDRGSCEFRLRLAQDPSRSDQFGPWHLADRIISPAGHDAVTREPHDAYAIRYRVL